MPQWHFVAKGAEAFGMVFQSFFYWKCRNGRTRKFHHRICITVSILLLLEMPQWPGCAPMKPRRLFWFQSFFYWKCRNGPGLGRQSVVRRHRFNPSFTGNAAMAYAHWLVLLAGLRSFNPSFTGNAAMANQTIFPRIPLPSFNPSFTGNAAMASENCSRVSNFLMFQSFFYWKCRNGC